ncbi:MAG TPA: CAP domain-containing protein [Candidatus Dormibacteraeota bacterium]
MERPTDTAWEELSRTAAAVRVAAEADVELARPSWVRRYWRRALLSVAGTVLCGLGTVWVLHTPTLAVADGGADSTLFSLTNQDRASNGVRSVNFNGALQTVGENGGYNCGGIHVNGRSLDMIQRNYFSHIIQGCGTYVWPMMTAYGVNFRSAGENIGWVNNDPGGTNAAGVVNTAFMNSPDHRSNILNGNYTDLGVGSAYGGTWSGDPACGNPCSQVWMFSEEFAQLSAAPPPPPPPPPNPGPSNPAPRNSPAPPTPDQTPVQTPAPTPTPTPTPAPTPTPVPTALQPTNVPAPPTYVYPGLLPSTVESVLTSFLIS